MVRDFFRYPITVGSVISCSPDGGHPFYSVCHRSSLRIGHISSYGGSFLQILFNPVCLISLMASVSKECEECGEYYSGDANGKEITCPNCGNEAIQVSADKFSFDTCICCNCNQFYRRKDFNQLLGCLIIIVGALLVPITYGLSLVVVLLVDLILYRRVAELIVCYKCGAEFRGFGPIPEIVELFNHHIGELYEN